MLLAKHAPEAAWLRHKAHTSGRGLLTSEQAACCKTRQVPALQPVWLCSLGLPAMLHHTTIIWDMRWPCSGI